MKSLLKATSLEELNQIFLDIKNSKENGVKGILLKNFFNLIFNLLIYFSIIRLG